MMTQALAENGASKVYILGRRLEKLEEVAKTAVCGILFLLPRHSSSNDPTKLELNLCI